MTLPVDGRYVVETTLEVLATTEAVAAVEAEIKGASIPGGGQSESETHRAVCVRRVITAAGGSNAPSEGGHRPPNWAVAGGQCPPYVGKLPLAGH